MFSKHFGQMFGFFPLKTSRVPHITYKVSEQLPVSPEVQGKSQVRNMASSLGVINTVLETIPTQSLKTLTNEGLSVRLSAKPLAQLWVPLSSLLPLQ